MRKLRLSILLSILILVVSCSKPIYKSVENPIKFVSANDYVYTEKDVSEIEKSNQKLLAIAPAGLDFGNIKAGNQIEWTLVIYNSFNESKQFEIYPMVPSNVKDGREKVPQVLIDSVTFTKEFPIEVKSKSFEYVTAIISVPNNFKEVGTYSMLFVVNNLSNTENIIVQNTSEWLLTFVK